MKYMLMLYADEKAGAAIAPADMAKAMDTLYAYRAALQKAGAYVMDAPLARTWDAKTVGPAGGDGELKVHDGPYAETREQLGGFYVIDVPTMDEALSWASRCPAAQWGPVEVRAFVVGFD